MKELFSLGPFSFHFFGVMIAIGVLTGYYLALKEARRKNINEDLVANLILFSILGGFLGARLGFIVFYNPGYYLARPLEILFINEGGLSIHGGILGGMLTGIGYIKAKKLPLFKSADALIPALILGQAIGRVGCDVFGIPMTKVFFWGVNVDNVIVHPAQVYEFVLDYLLFGYLWLKRLNLRYDGQLLVNYLIIFPIIRSIVELFRTNPTVFGMFSISHLLSIILIISGLILRSILIKKPLPLKVENPPVSRTQLINTILVTFVLIIVSLTIFYLVQG
ncbi:MAG: phosphatidylglycerol---prolipoprotein diacylglyceryl transferase [Clostridia bacterium]|jgi:phosphatidylglycerol:prolipoprotein diacylglycerol transferase|nr:phosphatidylglycerol---prolipoprotein diacylglyceryl transferase [Clostridia bacterium]MDN5322237.1 phosphatidylglycerol---prolipoprotein diacylglyceryl transferase [Clostridia bacterium]